MKNLRTRSLVCSLLLMTAVVTESIGVAHTRTDSSVIDGFAPELSDTQHRLIEDGRAADVGEAANRVTEAIKRATEILKQGRE